MKRFNKKFRKGFSIAEVVISVFVITVGMLAILKLTTGSMTYSILSRDQIIASQLSQEGIELIRNIRDNNIFNSRSWSNGLGDNANACVEFNMATTQSDNAAFSLDCDNGNQLFYDLSSYTYNHDNTDEATRFNRQIVIDAIDNFPIAAPDGTVDEVDIISIVWWGSSQPAIASCTVAEKCVLIRDTLLGYE